MKIYDMTPRALATIVHITFLRTMRIALAVGSVCLNATEMQELLIEVLYPVLNKEMS